jgi:hypothetical protein
MIALSAGRRKPPGYWPLLRGAAVTSDWPSTTQLRSTPGAGRRNVLAESTQPRLHGTICLALAAPPSVRRRRPADNEAIIGTAQGVTTSKVHV